MAADEPWGSSGVGSSRAPPGAGVGAAVGDAAQPGAPGHKTQPFPPASFPGFVRFCPKLRLGKKEAPSITLCSAGGFRDGLTSWQGDGEALLQQENTNAGSQSRDGGGGRAGDAPQGYSTGLLAVPR